MLYYLKNISVIFWFSLAHWEIWSNFLLHVIINLSYIFIVDSRVIFTPLIKSTDTIPNISVIFFLILSKLDGAYFVMKLDIFSITLIVSLKNPYTLFISFRLWSPQSLRNYPYSVSHFKKSFKWTFLILSGFSRNIGKFPFVFRAFGYKLKKWLSFCISGKVNMKGVSFVSSNPFFFPAISDTIVLWVLLKRPKQLLVSRMIL